jgi:hypothetical protein
MHQTALQCIRQHYNAWALSVLQGLLQVQPAASAAVQSEQYIPDAQLAQAELDLHLAVAQLEETLHISVGYILPTLLGMCQADLNTSAAGSSSGSTASGVAHSSSNSSSSSSDGNVFALVDGQAIRGPHKAYQHVLNYICCLNFTLLSAAHIKVHGKAEFRAGFDVEDRGVAPAAAAKSAAAASAAADLAVAGPWCNHAVQLCSSLEGYLRVQAARPGGGSLIENDRELACLCSAFNSLAPYTNSIQWYNGGLLQAALAAGPGSVEQAQLFGLMCSLLKYVVQLPPQNGGVPADIVLGAALAAASILQGAGDRQQQQQQQTSAAEAASEASAQAADPPSKHSARDMLPWMVLLGRCCSIWAMQLSLGDAGGHPDDPVSYHVRCLRCTTFLDVFAQFFEADELPLKVQVTPVTVTPMTVTPVTVKPVTVTPVAVTPVDPPASAAAGPADDATPSDTSITLPSSCLIIAQTWLSGPETSAQLTAAGYDVALLNTKLDAALQAVSALQQTSAAAEAEAAGAAEAAAAAAAVQLVQQLRALGKVLSTLAIPSACNNPACSNISGPSEAALVKGSSSTCAGCRVARYCCKSCQNQHWKVHKPACKALAAARARGTAV